MQKKFFCFVFAVLLGLPAKVLSDPSDLDTTFNGVGTRIISLGDSSSCHGIALQPDGKLVMAGVAVVGGVNRFAVVRLTLLGDLDTTFNLTGIQTLLIGDDSTAYGVAVQTDGKIVVAGSTSISSVGSAAAARFNADGSLDTDFNGTGTQSAIVGDFSFGYSGALQPDGRILVVGFSQSDGVQKIALARFDVHGVLDPSFNGSGTRVIELGSGAQANGAVVQPDGKIIIVGQAFVDGAAELFVMRLKTDGSLDDGFNGTGYKIVVLGSNSVGMPVVMHPDGKIVVGGTSDNHFAVARLLGDQAGPLSGDPIPLPRHNIISWLKTIYAESLGFAPGNCGNEADPL